MTTECIRRKFINTIKINNCSAKSNILNKLFDHINETDEFFSYKVLIRRDLHTPLYSFGKFFLQNGGIRKHIQRIYYHKQSHSDTDTLHFQICLVFDIQINKNTYGCYIEAIYDEGCKSCGMGRDIDNFMYISHNLETLIMCCLPPSSFCFMV